MTELETFQDRLERALGAAILTTAVSEPMGACIDVAPVYRALIAVLAQTLVDGELVADERDAEDFAEHVADHLAAELVKALARPLSVGRAH